MKYIGIGMMWLGYAGMVAALAFAPKVGSEIVVLIAVFIGIELAVASTRIAKSGKG